MATTRISDVIVPEVYETYTAVDSPEKTLFMSSGIIVRNGMLDGKANSGGETINLPFWKDLDSTVEESLSSSDPAVVADAEAIATASQVARVGHYNKWYSNSALASQIAGSDANSQVRNRFGTYWMRRFQKKVLPICSGLMLENVANGSSDMIVNKAVESIASQTAATKWSRQAYLDVLYTMGDAADEIQAIAVHSAIEKQMNENDDIDTIPDSEGNMVKTFMGKRIIVDDGMTVTAGTTDGLKYTTILFGAGAFGYGEGTPANPVGFKTEEMQGNGAGVDYLGERKIWIIHPFGYKTKTDPTAEGGFSNTELATAAVWERVIDRKSVPLAFLVTN